MVAPSRSVLVTGASSGIGAATVDALVSRGFHVWATVRAPDDEERLTERHKDGVVTVVRCDITSQQDVAALGEQVVGAAGLWGLVANAGTAFPSPLELIHLDAFRAQLEVNLVGQLSVVQAVLPALLASRGRIVMVGSIGGRIAGPMLGAYHATKFGLVGLSDSLRAELAPSGIRVVLIEPGTVATRIWATGREVGERLLESAPPAARERYRHQIARLRADATRAAEHGLPPSEVAEVVACLASERSSYITGQVIAVDGGLRGRAR